MCVYVWVRVDLVQMYHRFHPAAELALLMYLGLYLQLGWLLYEHVTLNLHVEGSRSWKKLNTEGTLLTVLIVSVLSNSLQLLAHEGVILETTH